MRASRDLLEHYEIFAKMRWPLWSLSLLLLLFAIHLSYRAFSPLREELLAGNLQFSLQRVNRLVREFHECLSSGLIPEESRWLALRDLPYPWGTLIFTSLRDLRAAGGALLPTLKRISDLVEHQCASLEDARARSAGAIAQCGVCLSLVPLFGYCLNQMLPHLQDCTFVWYSACSLAFLLAGSGALWILRLATAARWGGLQGPRKIVGLHAEMSGERFLSLLRSGRPADQAWIDTFSLLEELDSPLRFIWSAHLWEESPPGRSLEEFVRQTGEAIKKAVHLSLMEGRPCTERIEAALRAHRHQMKAQIERQLGLLGTRALKPLFICVAPSLIGLLILALWLGVQGEDLWR